ncbi:MAG: hypothetical protein K0R57_1484 [Paenibacillaceae bacterium]|jgi:hypothetical protein|nr:hypothetical protein [Paenibacillaceae bacterium]
MKRKILTCLAIFAVLFILGWRGHQQLANKEMESAPKTNHDKEIKAYFLTKDNGIVEKAPFLPREYVRIVRYAEEW